MPWLTEPGQGYLTDPKEKLLSQQSCEKGDIGTSVSWGCRTDLLIPCIFSNSAFQIPTQRVIKSCLRESWCSLLFWPRSRLPILMGSRKEGRIGRARRERPRLARRFFPCRGCGWLRIEREREEYTVVLWRTLYAWFPRWGCVITSLSKGVWY